MERGARKIALTNEGALLRRRAEELVALADKTEQEFVSQNERLDRKRRTRGRRGTGPVL